MRLLGWSAAVNEGTVTALSLREKHDEGPLQVLAQIFEFAPND